MPMAAHTADYQDVLAALHMLACDGSRVQVTQLLQQSSTLVHDFRSMLAMASLNFKLYCTN